MTKRRLLVLSVLSLVLALGLSACTVNLNLGKDESSLDEVISAEEPVSQEEAPKEKSSEEAEESVSETEASEIETPTSNLSLEDAKDVFSKTYPDAVIDIAKTEGEAYYIQGYEGSDICKMKILSHDGSVVMSKRITTGRGNKYR